MCKIQEICTKIAKMKPSIFLVLLFAAQALYQPCKAQDVIERSYFPNAQAKNAAIAAARYAEEGYFYTRFTTYISAVDSSRMFADTALFFVKRSLMLSDTSLHHAPVSNKDAINFLLSGKTRATTADSVIRGFYPMVDIKSHHFFGREATHELSNATMDFFSASLLLRPEDGSKEEEVETYDVLPFDEEVIRLEADEAAFQHLVNHYENEVAVFDDLAANLSAELGRAPDQKTRADIRSWLSEVEAVMDHTVSGLEDASFRIQEIRLLLDKKYLKDLENSEVPEHLSQFGANGTQGQTVQMDEKLPDGLVYKIQMGYYPSDVDIDNFRGLFPITGETVRKGVSRLYAGIFFSYAEASKGLTFVRENAIANAFIVPFYQGEKISMSRAVEVELDRGVR